MLEYELVAGATVIILGYGTYLWILGQRSRALYYFELAVNTLVMVLLVGSVFYISNTVVKNLFGFYGLNALPTHDALRPIPKYLDEIHREAVAWITYVAATRAVLALAPFLSPLNYVVGSATGWCVQQLGMVATTFLALTVFSRAFLLIMPYLMLLGVSLTPIPKLRGIGAALLSLYLVMGVAIFISGNIALEAVSTIQDRGLEAPKEDWDTLIETVNPLNWRFVVEGAVAVSWILFDAAIKVILVFVFASTLTAATSLALGGVYTWIQPV